MSGVRALLLAICALAPLSAHAQTPGHYGYKQALPSDQLNKDLGSKADADHGMLHSPAIDQIVHDGFPSLTFTGTAPVNASRNPGIAPLYFGKNTFEVSGFFQSPDGHYSLNGTTRGWADGTCLLAINANPAVAGPANGCGQGGFWDPWFRTVYPGQDSETVSFGISGIVPVAKKTPAVAFSSLTVMNFAGQPQIVGTVTLSPPLSQAQVAAINNATDPIRVQVNNGYFGYTVPAGLTVGGQPVAAASADGQTLLVDNWTRAVSPNNGDAPGVAGGTAAFPTLPYYIPPGAAGIGHGGGAGTGMFPNQVGMVNGSPPLPRYTVTIDGNLLAEIMYLNARSDPDDIVDNLRISEEGIINNKTGTSTWNDLSPLSDLLDGEPFASQMHLASCLTDDGLGLGTCGAYAYIWNGIKRGIVFDNAQASLDEGATMGVLDISSTFGWKSVKTTGYTIWLDPGDSGLPEFVLDAVGNLNSKKRIYVGNGAAGINATGVLITPDGNVQATGTLGGAGWSMKSHSGGQTGYGEGETGNIVTVGGLAPGNFAVDAEPGCNSSYLGMMIFLSDARKPGETAGNGSGVPATCTPPIKGASPEWLSLYDHLQAVH